MNKLIRIVVDPRVEPGNYIVGGVQLVHPKNDRELGQELRTTRVRVHSKDEARHLAGIVNRTEGLELVA